EKKAFGEWTELVGTTMPLPGRGAAVSTLVEGRVEWLLGKAAASDSRRLVKAGPGDFAPVAEGQTVKEGQALIRLDDQVARSHRDKMVHTLKDLEEQKNQADYAVELAEIDVRRLKKLIEEKTGGTPA